MLRSHNIVCCCILVAARSQSASGPCDITIENSIVCEAANQQALKLMGERHVRAIMVMQDVRTGSVLAFAASDPKSVDVTTSLLPLSTVKLLVAASWLNHQKYAPSDFPAGKLLMDSIANGNDDAGRQLASALRKQIGTETAIRDFEAYGFPFSNSATTAQNESFWSEISPVWRGKLIPGACYFSLNTETTTKDWEDTLSIGEAHFMITALHLSRFLQAVGNRGIMLPPKARSSDEAEVASQAQPHRIMDEAAASELGNVMRQTVERGTAKNIAPILAGTGWSIGGKTGTGPGPNSPERTSDGWFAGLIFDPQGDARFTVATFVKHGGLGGGNAAWLSAELARFVIGVPPKS